MLLELVDFEVEHLPVRACDRLRRKIDRQPRIGPLAGVVHQRLDRLGRQHDRQDAVLEAVAVEDIGEAGRDDSADAIVQQRPGRVLARAAAAEVLTRDDDLGLAVGGLVQDEVRVLGAVLIITHFLEQVLAQASAVDCFQELLGDDHVGIDIDQRHGRRDPGQRGEVVHVVLSKGKRVIEEAGKNGGWRRDRA